MPIGIKNENGKDPFETFLDDLKEPREVIQETVDIPEPEPVGQFSIHDEPAPDPILEEKKAKVAKIPAEVIVDVIDTTAVSINSYIAMEPVDGATSTEKDSLQKAVANYLRDTDIDISPGKLCIVLIALIYGPKVVQSFQLRKKNIELAQLHAKLKFYEGKDIDRQQQVKEDKDEVSSM